MIVIHLTNPEQFHSYLPVCNQQNPSLANSKSYLSIKFAAISTYIYLIIGPPTISVNQYFHDQY